MTSVGETEHLTKTSHSLPADDDQNNHGDVLNIEPKLNAIFARKPVKKEWTAVLDTNVVQNVETEDEGIELADRSGAEASSAIKSFLAANWHFLKHYKGSIVTIGLEGGTCAIEWIGDLLFSSEGDGHCVKKDLVASQDSATGNSCDNPNHQLPLVMFDMTTSVLLIAIQIYKLHQVSKELRASHEVIVEANEKLPKIEKAISSVTVNVELLVEGMQQLQTISGLAKCNESIENRMLFQTKLSELRFKLVPIDRAYRNIMNQIDHLEVNIGSRIRTLKSLRIDQILCCTTNTMEAINKGAHAFYTMHCSGPAWLVMVKSVFALTYGAIAAKNVHNIVAIGNALKSLQTKLVELEQLHALIDVQNQKIEQAIQELM